MCAVNDDAYRPMTPVDPEAREPPGRGLLLALLLAGFVAIASTVAIYAAPAKGEMGVVFPIGTDERTAYALVLESGGQFVGPSLLGNVVVAFASDEGFAERVRKAGALFVMAAYGLCRQPPAEYAG